VAIGPWALVNDSHQVAFSATLNSTTGYNYSGALDRGIWVGAPGSLQVAVRSGDPAPGMPPLTNIESIVGGNEFRFNNAGELAFQTMVAGPAGFRRRAVYRWTSGTLTPLILEGQAAPGAPQGASFFPGHTDGMNDRGDVVIRSALVVPPSCPPPCPNEGLWLSQGATLRTIAITRTVAPGAPPGTTISGAGMPVALNEASQVVLQATLSGPISGQGLLGWTAGSGLFPIAIPGQQLETEPGRFRTVLSAGIAGTFGNVSGSGSSSSLADDGTLIFEVRFTDQLRGIFQGEFGSFAGGFFDCPAVIGQSRAVTLYTGSAIVLTVQAVGSPTLSYQWRRNGSPLVNGGRVSGADTPSLMIAGGVMGDSGTYDVVVANACGSTMSDPVPVSVLCYANCDGSTGTPLLNVNDFVCFQSRFAAGEPYANCDGSTIPPTLNVNDFLCFLGEFAAGCP
jgi:hypothetical protein